MKRSWFEAICGSRIPELSHSTVIPGGCYVALCFLYLEPDAVEVNLMQSLTESFQKTLLRDIGTKNNYPFPLMQMK